MRILNIAIFAAALLLNLSESTLAQAKCLSTLSELKANNVKARWQEATENDGKPLTISIADAANGLVYSAKKAGVLWLTGNVSVCLSGGATGFTLKNTQATSNVPMVARLALPSTQSAEIVNDQTKLGGGGWAEPSLVNNRPSVKIQHWPCGRHVEGLKEAAETKKAPGRPAVWSKAGTKIHRQS